MKKQGMFIRNTFKSQNRAVLGFSETCAIKCTGCHLLYLVQHSPPKPRNHWTSGPHLALTSRAPRADPNFGSFFLGVYVSLTYIMNGCVCCHQMAMWTFYLKDCGWFLVQEALQIVQTCAFVLPLMGWKSLLISKVNEENLQQSQTPLNN